MSRQPANLSLARTTSLRVAASAASPPVTAGGGGGAASTAPLALFLTNLRLLDLDLLPDWPGITTATFSAKDAAGGQKKRVQSVEWALYRLFERWEPDEARAVSTERVGGPERPPI